MDQLRAGVSAKQVVLVVDDNSAVRNSLRFTLEVEGFEVRAFVFWAQYRRAAHYVDRILG